METNFFGQVYCTKWDYFYFKLLLKFFRYALPLLKKNCGQIIVLSSFSGEIGLPFRTAYCSSKFALTGFFEALRMEQDSHKISITIVCPPSVNIE